MAESRDELSRTYVELLLEKLPFLRLHDLLEFCQRCVEEDFGASDLIELHLSTIASGHDHKGAQDETVLSMALSFRMLLQQLRDSHGEVVHLEQANREVSNLYRTKSRTLSMVAHDLSNYLVTSRILALSMVRDASKPAVRERAQLMLKVLEDQEHLIANLLNIGKIEAGLPVLSQQVDLRAVIARCVEAARRMSGHRFSVSGPNLQALAEEAKVRQILENLVGNAVKYSPPGGVVEIVVSRQDDQAVVAVRDYGSGIAPDDLPHVFEPYYRAPDGQTGGTGLGLSIVKSLIDLLHGDIRIESGQGGTTVRFSLPLASG